MMKRIFLLVCGLASILLIVLAGLVGFTWAVGRVVPLHTAQIAYTSEHDGSSDLFLVDMPRHLTHRLTWEPLSDRDPAWSPDGEWLAFVSNRDFDEEIYLLHVYTGAIRQLTENQVADHSPAWSPDGQKIAFASSRSGSTDLFVTDVFTGETVQLTANSGWNSAPTWSPDGQWLVFTSNREGYGMLYVMPATGGDARQITQNAGWYLNPAWSPDSRWIAFDSGGVTDSEIYLLDTTCLQSGLDCAAFTQRLTQNDRLDAGPAWSPDSRHIIYTSGAGFLRYNLVAVPTDCYRIPSGCETAVQVITDERFVDWSPVWRP